MQVQVQVPPGVQPGQQFQVQTPDGQLVSVTVPQGVPPGGALTLNVPAPQPVQAAVVECHPMTQPLLPADQAGATTFEPLTVQPLKPAANYDRPLSAGGGAASADQVVMGTPVEDAMPKLPAASTLSDKYTGYQYSTEQSDEAGSHHTGTLHEDHAEASVLPMGAPVEYFTDAELATLSRQPLPADVFKGGMSKGQTPAGEVPIMGYAVAQSASTAVATGTVLTTASGMPVVTPTTRGGISSAETCYDGWTGLKSCAPQLQGARIADAGALRPRTASLGVCAQPARWCSCVTAALPRWQAAWTS